MCIQSARLGVFSSNIVRVGFYRAAADTNLFQGVRGQPSLDVALGVHGS